MRYSSAGRAWTDTLAVEFEDFVEAILEEPGHLLLDASFEASELGGADGKRER
jgi:hypothetical protein